MDLIFGLPALARYIALLASAVFILLLFAIRPPELDTQHLFSLIGQAAAWTGIAVWLVGRWVWRPIWRWLPCLERIVYPDLKGCWRGTITSNWPAIDAMAKSAKGGGALFDAVTHDHSEAIKESAVLVTARIWADWFGMAMRLETDKGYSESETRTITPLKGQQGNLHRLAYMYENRTRDPKPTDVSCHEGAACVSIKLGTPTRLEGVYWTNRGWQRGFNTAGLLNLELVDRNPNATLPRVPVANHRALRPGDGTR